LIHEDKVNVGGATKAPGYSFRLPGGKRLFFVEAKKPRVDVKDGIQPVYQVRGYGFTAKYRSVEFKIFRQLLSKVNYTFDVVLICLLRMIRTV